MFQDPVQLALKGEGIFFLSQCTLKNTGDCPVISGD